MAEPKVCKDCGKSFEPTTDNFFKHPGFADGLDNRCKACRKEERLALIKRRAEAQKDTGTAAASSTSTPRATEPKPKPRKKPKARKMPALPTLSSDRIVSEMIDVANIVKNGKVLLRQKCEELLAALDKESNG